MEAIIALARYGLFLPSPSSTVDTADRRPFGIRILEEGDLEALNNIEHACWGDLALSSSDVLRRVRCRHASHWVCEVNRRVVGVLYTRKLSRTEILLQQDVRFSNQDNLICDDIMTTIQLLGVAVLPEFAHLQIGGALRDFVLQLAQLEPNIRTVVAMTRCSSETNGTEADYYRKVASGADPTLQFHVGGGAEVIQVVPQFRPEDRLNFGHAVLVRYDLHKPDPEAMEPTPVAATSVASFVAVSELRELVASALEAPRAAAVVNLSQEEFLDAAFMDLGLSSLGLMELRAQLGARWPAAPLSPTILFDYPTPRQLLGYLSAPTGAQSAPVRSLAVPKSCFDSHQSFAICSMSCRLPGGVSSPEALYEALVNKTDAVCAVPKEWNWDARVKHAAFLSPDCAESFDPAFFKLNAAEARQMDPHQRLLLEVAHEALAAAGVLSAGSAKEAVSRKVGVFVGLSNTDWRASDSPDGASLGPYDTTGSAPSAAANRISFLLGLEGPSLVVDTACSSSLAALHTALNSLRCGDCDVALVAAADLIVSSHSLKIREAANMLSPDGKNRSFDDAANGYVRGEGAGALVIKPLARAKADIAATGCGEILAVIRGSAMNQDGRSASFTAPNGSAQRALLRAALENSRVSAAEVAFIEAHGTGTPLGDPIEWGAIRDVLLAAPDRDSLSPTQKPLVIGAIKSNIGHLEAAAGLAGLIKTVCCLRHRVAPPNLHFTTMNTKMIVDPSHRVAVFPVAATPLSPAAGGREIIASVSSFGSGGTNANVIVESYTEAAASEHVPAAVTATGDKPKVVFLCTGQGLVYNRMGLQLFEAEPSFKEAILRCSAAVPSLQPSLAEVLYSSKQEVADLVNAPQYSQLALFALEVALASVWRSRGVTPDVICGHSLGEYAAAVIAGIMTPETGAYLVHLRLQCLQELGASVSANGAMLAIRCSEAEVLTALQRVENAHLAALAGVNGSAAVVLSGERSVLDAVLKELGAPTHKYLPVDFAYHSPLVGPTAQRFAQRFEVAITRGDVTFSEPTTAVAFVSCKTGAVLSTELLKSPAYWVEQMISPVRFHDCVVTLRDAIPGTSLCVELGPHDTLTKQVGASLPSWPAFASLLHNRDSLDTFNAAHTAVRMRLQWNVSRLGGRLSPDYHPVPMPWRRKYDTTRSLAVAESLRRESFTTRRGVVYHVARGALLSVLPPEATEFLADNTSFLSLGLDSLAAQAIRNAIANSLELPSLANTVVLRHPTLEELVEHLEDSLATASAQRVAEPSTPSKQSNPADEAVFDVNDLLEDGVEAEFPATCMQQAMLFHHISDPDVKSFIETFRWEVRGPLDVRRFHEAWNAVIRATPALRSTFDPYAVPVPVQRVWSADSIASLNCSMGKASWFKVVDVDGTGHENAAHLAKVADDEQRAQRAWSYELSSPLLLRLAVVSGSAERHVVLLTLHHAVIDGHSIRLALQAVGECYQSGEPNLSALESQLGASYGLFAEFERQLVRSDQAAQRYWRGVLQGWQSGPHAMVNMPAMKVNLPDEEVVRVQRSVDPETLQSLQAAARKASVTLAAFFHAAWGAVYAKLTCNEDILYGNTTAGRSARLPQIAGIVGPVINTFPMRYTVPAGQSVGDYLHTVQRALLNSLEFENYPLAEIQKLAPISGSLFSVIFDFQTATWNHSFSAADGRQIEMSESRLLDRIGCPVSVRVVVDGDALQLHATSECREYGATVLDSMLYSLVTVATFMAEVVTGGNPLRRDARARVFDLMDLVPLCRNRKLSIVTFTEEEEKQLDSVHFPVASSGNAVVAGAEVEYVLPNLGACSSPTNFPILLEAEDLLNFNRRCREVGCEGSTVALAFFLWAARMYASSAGVSVNVTSCSASNATKHLTLDCPSDVSFHVLLAAVTSAVAVDQSHVATKSRSSLLFTCSANPVVPAETAAALIWHEAASRIALDLKFPTSSVPVEVMEGVHDALQVLLNHFVSVGVFEPSQRIYDLLPLPGTVPGLRPDCAVSDRLLHEDAYRNTSLASSSSHAVVQYSGSAEPTTLTYAEITRIADMVAGALSSHVLSAKAVAASSSSTCVIAVVMEKGWEQVAAVLAVLRLQCAYLPMDARLWPEQRIRQVLELSEAVAVLTQPHLLASSTLSWMAQLSIPVVGVSQSVTCASADVNRLETIPTVSADALAYLIYTSGSTGIPKGVCCHHRGAMNTIDDLNSLFSVTAQDKVLALSSISFDLSVYDIFGLLSAGGTVVIPDPNTVSPPDPSEWFDLVETEQITIWNTVPAFMELLVGHAEYMGLKLPACLRLVYMSGDWIPVTLPNRIRAVSDCPDIRIISMGGATEASIWSNIFELENTPSGGVPAGWSSIPYGRPMRNQRMCVLNERMEHCDVWVTGAIYIGGVGVAHGYYKNPERTAYQFVRHPVTGEFLFRTGDLGRVRPEGLIEILGREDSQVKVNGFRIELGEIERVLLEHRDVASAALAVHNNTLCAYLVMRNDASLDVEALRAMCKARLAEYMVPHHFMVIDEIPLSANGKVQRDKLPKIQVEDVRVEGAECPVLCEKEKILAGIWGGLLGINAAAIPLNANFFSLGGDSLRSVQVVAQAKKFGLLLSVPQIFSHPTLRALAEVANSFRELGPEVLGTSSDAVDSKPIFTVDQRDDLMYEEYPLIGINQAHYVGLHTSSYAREGTTPQIYFEWEIGQPHGGGDGDFGGQVDVPRLERAIDCFVQRHATFRSVVCKNGTMRVLKEVPSFVIRHVQKFDGDAEVAKDKALAYRTHMMDNGPTVHDWPLFEVRVTHTSATSSLVHINVSLFLMDAMSDLILRQELSALYRGDPTADVAEVLPPPSRLQFKDYCRALTDKLHNTEEYQRAKAYWLARIDDLGSGPELPSLPPQLEAKESGILTGKFVNFHRWLTVQEWKRARKNCAFHSVTMPAVLLAAYSIVLYRWGSRDKFLVNILQCLRHQVHEDVNKMVGNCSSTILCDIDLRRPAKGELTFRLAVQRVAQELSQNLEHASMSGVEVMQELNRIRGKTFKAVAPFIFTTPIGVEKGNKQVASRDWMFQEKFFSERVPHTACVNAIKADPNGTACASLDVVDGVFPKEVMTGMYDTYHALIDVICAEDPNAWHAPINCKVPLPGPVPSIREECVVSDRLMHTDISAHAKRSTAAADIAVVQYGEQSRTSFSYTSLHLAAQQAACKLASHVLRAKAAISSSNSTCVIAVVMEKGWEQVAAVLAVLRLQCAYLPMDARLWPEQRIRQVLELSEAVAVLTQPNLLASSTLSWMTTLAIPVVAVRSTTEEPSAALVDQLRAIPAVNADALAYLIYTSGSTGIPKGVCCHHRGAMNTIDDLNSLFSVTAQDKVLALSSLSFDLSVYDIFGLLSAGGTVVIPDPNTVSPPDPSKWYDIVVQEQITIWNTVPAFMELLVSHAEYMGLKLPACLRLVYMSGDWIPVTLPNRIRAVSDCPDMRIISMGGATEASIWSNIFELENTPSGGVPAGWSSIPYGRPMRNQRMYVLNERMEHCDVWVTGAIYIGGVGVAHGYYKNPERTAYQFVRHPVTGEFLFRTGDLGRVRPEGLIEILGREDSQVKVNGFRIELGEIERVLLEHRDVASAALAVHNNTLCAYLVMQSTFDRAADEAAEDTVFETLQAACKVKLAEYMVPKHFMFIDEIPLSANGKVQRELLPSPQHLLSEARKRSNSITDRLVLPASELEEQVRRTFAKILNCAEDTICCKRSTFFDLGGNSLTSIQLIFALRDAFGVTIGVQDLFRSPTVIGVCGLITMDKDFDGTGKGQAQQQGHAEGSAAGGLHIEQLQLNDGDRDAVPLILFNPAGASGLCYMPLVQQLHKTQPVYVLDDGVMTSGRPFAFTSIEQVAETCLPFVRAIAAAHSQRGVGDRKQVVTLGGWSYGGVVASTVAKLLARQGTSVGVKSLVLFDAPLRSPPNKHKEVEGEDGGQEEQEGVSGTAPDVVAPTEGANGAASYDLQERTQAHFRACTDLLRQFYASQQQQGASSEDPVKALRCAVLDVRPEQTDYDCGVGAAEELTSGAVQRVLVPGSHWTMLFQDNVVHVGRVVRPTL